MTKGRPGLLRHWSLVGHSSFPRSGSLPGHQPVELDDVLAAAGQQHRSDRVLGVRVEGVTGQRRLVLADLVHFALAQRLERRRRADRLRGERPPRAGRVGRGATAAGHPLPQDGDRRGVVVADVVQLGGGRLALEPGDRPVVGRDRGQLAAQQAVEGLGAALLSPAITKRVIAKFMRIPQGTPPKELHDLSERELDVFRLIARGLSNIEIGQELYISDTTVKTHITHILQKLNLRDRVQAVVLAHETGLFDADSRAANQ